MFFITGLEYSSHMYYLLADKDCIIDKDFGKGGLTEEMKKKEYFEIY